jgi:hypothetical protein
VFPLRGKLLNVRDACSLSSSSLSLSLASCFKCTHLSVSVLVHYAALSISVTALTAVSAAHQQLLDNAELNHVKRILGLDHEKTVPLSLFVSFVRLSLSACLLM